MNKGILYGLGLLTGLVMLGVLAVSYDPELESIFVQDLRVENFHYWTGVADVNGSEFIMGSLLDDADSDEARDTLDINDVDVNDLIAYYLTDQGYDYNDVDINDLISYYLTNNYYETKNVARCWSITIDDPNSLTDPNVMMIPVDTAAYPYGIKVTSLAIKTRPATSIAITFLDYNSPTDASPDTIGVSTTSTATEDANDITDTDVAAGEIVFISIPTDTAINQLEAIVYGYKKVE